MLICPNCHQPLHQVERSHSCRSCGWTSSTAAGIEQFFSDVDRVDPTFKDYLTNYDVIADEDLASSIMNEEYVKYLAQQTAALLPDISGKNVCDIGIGKGFLTNELIAKGAMQVTAVDISLAFLTRMLATPNVKPVQANAENLPYESHFDIVVSTDVLEHVLNVGSFLISVNRSLVIDGCFVVRVPNSESLLKYSPLIGCKYRFVHLRAFNKQLLSTMLRDSGFELTAYDFGGYWLDIPRNFWTKTAARVKVLEKFKSWMLRKVNGDPHKVSFFSQKWLLNIFLMPVELTIAARKIKSI